MKDLRSGPPPDARQTADAYAAIAGRCVKDVNDIKRRTLVGLVIYEVLIIVK